MCPWRVVAAAVASTTGWPETLVGAQSAGLDKRGGKRDGIMGQGKEVTVGVLFTHGMGDIEGLFG
jgi:hypothetical protein